MTDVVVVGAGGFGRETLDVIEAHNRVCIRPEDRLNVMGIIDDNPSTINIDRLRSRHYEVLGGLDFLIANRPAEAYVLGIGSPRVKKQIAERLDREGLHAQGVIHPQAVVGSDNIVEPGVIVCSGAQISTNVQLDRHVHVNPNATIGHDTHLAEFTSINPGAIVSGEVYVGPTTLVGAGAVILQGLFVGTGCTIGASACVTKDVPSGKTAVGIPARWAT